MALSMPPSLASDPSCLASLPSNSKLLALLSQHRSSQVTTCSPGWRLKSFRMSRSSIRDRDRAMISVSFSRPAMTLAHRHPSQRDLLSLRLSLVLQGRLLPAQVGHWAQLQCLQLELGLEPLLCPPGKLSPPLQLWQRQWWCRSGGL